MASPRVVERGLGAGPGRELDGETWCYVNMFSTPARQVLDELFGPHSVRERPLLQAFPHRSVSTTFSVTKSAVHRRASSLWNHAQPTISIRIAARQRLLSCAFVICDNDEPRLGEATETAVRIRTCETDAGFNDFAVRSRDSGVILAVATVPGIGRAADDDGRASLPGDQKIDARNNPQSGRPGVAFTGQGQRQEYPKHRECFSCHNQAVPAVALSLAQERGFDIGAERCVPLPSTPSLT